MSRTRTKVGREELTTEQIFLHFLRQCVRCLGPARPSYSETLDRRSLGAKCIDVNCGFVLSYEQVMVLVRR